jgi:membrane-bound lytic murein transglycosylase F
MKATGRLEEIRERYYADVERFDYVDLRAFHRRLETRLPRFLGPLRKAAARHGFDWRLIAAMAYQESHLDPEARSPAGAQGLMQLTRRTARSYGVRRLTDPEENLAAGIRHLRKLYDFFNRARGRDRLFIAMAAYNVGQGHILDARNLARDRDLNPDDWEVLSGMLPLLSEPEYYEDAIYGYCRGSEPVRYVRQIMIYYDILRRKYIEYKAVGDSKAETAAEPSPHHPGGDHEG